MEQYHIGKEIEKECKKHSLTVAGFARALNIERQSAYNYFKNSHIATDRLMQISKLFNRDFFKELSDVYAQGEEVAEVENEESVKEGISQLMPEDKLHVVNPAYVGQIADEYFSSPRKKPLLIFMYNPGNPNQKTIREVGESILGEGMIKSITVKEGGETLVESQIKDLAALPQKAIELWYNGSVSWNGSGCDNLILLAEKLIAGSGKFVYIFSNYNNDVDHGVDEYNRNCIKYKDGVERCFSIWHDRVHIFVADNEGDPFLRNQQLYGSFKLCQKLKELYNQTHMGIHEEFDLTLSDIPEETSFSIHKEDVSSNLLRLTFTDNGLIANYRDQFKAAGVKLFKEVTIDIVKDEREILDVEYTEY